MEDYSERKREEKYSVEISLDGKGNIEKVELMGEKSSLWKRIIGINLKNLQMLNRNPGTEKNN